MKKLLIPWAVGLVALAASALAHAQSGKVDVGKREYEANCMGCHGAAGKGDGPYVEFLKRMPTDLTMLAKANGGILPLDRLYNSITGDSVAAHGRDMPVWGREYRIGAAAYYGDTPYDQEAFVRAKVLALLEYINRLQVK
jgi:mono/diheme cytochrome c family protein